jgi:hypothetical protein
VSGPRFDRPRTRTTFFLRAEIAGAEAVSAVDELQPDHMWIS